MDEHYDFRMHVRRLLSQPAVEAKIDTLKLIVTNILEHPEEQKFRRIKRRKLTDDVVTVLCLARFEVKVFEFEHHVCWLHDVQDDKSQPVVLLKLLRELIEEHAKTLEARAQQKKDAAKKAKEDKQRWEEIRGRIRDDIRERQATVEMNKELGRKVLFEGGS